MPDLGSSPSEGDLLDALGDLDSSFTSFFISFAVIGRYWVAHHSFSRLLGRMDYGLIWINLVFENPIAVVVYAQAPTLH